MQRTEYAVTTPTISTVFHSKPRCRANMYTPTCSTCSERFPGPLSPKPNEYLHFDLESCNLMCIYTVVTDPCHIPPLAQARPMMLCIYTSYRGRSPGTVRPYGQTLVSVQVIGNNRCIIPWSVVTVDPSSSFMTSSGPWRLVNTVLWVFLSRAIIENVAVGLPVVTLHTPCTSVMIVLI